MRLSYNGSAFHGWQIQPNASSVQEHIEVALTKMHGPKVGIVGCGRTDTGVHASDFYAHFDLEEKRYENDKLVYKLNAMLPKEISISEIYQVSEDFHARFSATARTYEYFITKVKDPFTIGQSWFLKKDVNLDLIREAAKELLVSDDFSSFAKLHTDVKTNICDVMHFDVQQIDQQIKFTIKANRFLRNMVRAIVGTLIEVGLEKISVEEFKNIIAVKNREVASSSAPGDGLFLSKIEYPEELLKELKG